MTEICIALPIIYLIEAHNFINRINRKELISCNNIYRIPYIFVLKKKNVLHLYVLHVLKLLLDIKFISK